MTANPFLTVEHTTATAIRIAEHTGRRTMVVRGDDGVATLRVVFDDASPRRDDAIVLIAEPAPANDDTGFAALFHGLRS